MHWITNTQFSFYVAKSAGITSECPIRAASPAAGFQSEKEALQFANIVHDGLNFVMIYDHLGKTIHAFGPNTKWCGF